mgnify:FL=1
MKKFLAKILVIAALVSGMAFAFSSCSSQGENYLNWYQKQPSEDNDKNNENEDKNDHNNDKKDNNGGGIWTPPVKE